MTFGLTRRQRAALLGASASTYVLSSVVFGQVLLAQEELPRPSAFMSVPRRPDPQSVAEVIRRDPFAGKPSTQSSAAPASESHVPDIEGPPPDADADAARAALDRTLLELKATIVGERPLAYVKDGGAIDIVHVGSKLGERTIAAIGLRGVRFDDGTSLELSTHASSSALAPAAGSAGGTTIEQLRRILVEALRGRGSLSSPAPEAAPSAAPSRSPETFPAPGGLPTIVPDFLPVGVSPTSAPNGPTPYPLPPLRPPY